MGRGDDKLDELGSYFGGEDSEHELPMGRIFNNTSCFPI